MPFSMEAKKTILPTIVAALAVALVSPAALAADADGKAVYNQHCATCHGPDGTGNAAMKSAFGVELNIAKPEIAAQKDDALAKVITDGKGKMPAAGKSLSPADKQAIVAYVKSLAK